MPAPTVYIRPKIIVEKVTINRPKVIARRNAHKNVILRAPSVAPVIVQRPRKPLIVHRSSVSRFHPHRRPILIRSFVAPTKPLQPLIRRQRAISRYHAHRRPIILRSAIAPIVFLPAKQPIVKRQKTAVRYYRHHKPVILRAPQAPVIPVSRSLMLIVGHNKSRLAYYRHRNKIPFILYPRSGSIPLPPPPDTGHHQMLFIDRFGIYV